MWLVTHRGGKLTCLQSSIQLVTGRVEQR